MVVILLFRRQNKRLCNITRFGLIILVFLFLLFVFIKSNGFELVFDLVDVFEQLGEIFAQNKTYQHRFPSAFLQLRHSSTRTYKRLSLRLYLDMAAAECSVPAL